MTEESQDGRTRRRERNVGAVLDAVHDLLSEGDVDLRPESVAARAGVSLRSVYRYFPDREQLVLAALEQRLGDAPLMFFIDEPGQGPRSARIDRFVDHRLAVHEAMAPSARVALVAARTMPLVADAVLRRRSQMHESVADHFAPDLDVLPSGRRQDCEQAIDVLCQFESIETLRAWGGHDAERVRAVLTAGVTAILATAD